MTQPYTLPPTSAPRQRAVHRAAPAPRTLEAAREGDGAPRRRPRPAGTLRHRDHSPQPGARPRQAARRPGARRGPRQRPARTRAGGGRDRERDRAERATLVRHDRRRPPAAARRRRDRRQTQGPLAGRPARPASTRQGSRLQARRRRAGTCPRRTGRRRQPRRLARHVPGNGRPAADRQPSRHARPARPRQRALPSPRCSALCGATWSSFPSVGRCVSQTRRYAISTARRSSSDRRRRGRPPRPGVRGRHRRRLASTGLAGA